MLQGHSPVSATTIGHGDESLFGTMFRQPVYWVDLIFEHTMLATRHLTAFFCVALVFGASRDLRTQQRLRPDTPPAALVTAARSSPAALDKYCCDLP